ncbi:hypothetical protein DdX_19442 [Ditylenchus destructor]|uniref:Uncharacterized protein n=1 Tax=Ditylenchus destructor TaxID=166010 RepID=A0AAD4MKG3_9BILA|nr:hypothetical protein DdX_19442 [Ditylenchus destructor]
MRLYLSLTFCLFFHQVHCTDPQAVPVIYHNQMRTDTVSFSFHAMPKGITVTVSPMEDPSEEYVNLAEETGLQIFQGQIKGHRQVLATHKCMAGATFSPTKTLDFHRPSCATRADPVKDPASPNRNL